ncbi:glycoside hydrolase family 92 protein [Pseudoduganella sp. FT25W]|uniref:Glycoside hydrolase family 92 protein n=1 Tax=Duganella alba TaxID=2666081 RepID=A0A6L5QA44_9BURK|nr:GH92 family glycosyl hydrolase [Duganella alba]MRX06546.1 glycoside hydrolase family 92 protein [Duganella alba]MRX14940.1 glycoside hydrolase family 92 protein [Duganella alba]
MNTTKLLLPAGALALVLALPAVSFAQTTPAAAVDVFIGTGGDGHTFPGATRPFGMIQLSPDTQVRPFRQSYPWAAGYRYEDDSILGFSHTHFSGAGHSDLGDVLLMPYSAETKWEPGYPERPFSGYRSRFSHKDEQASPGYYAVKLLDNDVDVELTASERVGLHRYRYQKGAEAKVMLDLRNSIYDYAGKNLWSRIRVRGDNMITGMRETRGWAPGRQLYFAIQFSHPLVSRDIRNFERDVEYKGFAGPGKGTGDKAVTEGKALAAALDFGVPADGQLEVKVAISAVSEDGAVANLNEMKGWDFDAERAKATAAWNEALGTVSIEAEPDTRKMVYTALYHSMLAPSLFMDSDGQYRGPDNAVHQAKGFRFHSTFSLWDTYRALHPLMTILQPERDVDFVRSLIESQKVSPYGILPVWQFAGQETWCMIGYHAVPVIADAYMKGLKGFDAEEALKAMTSSAEYGPYGGLQHYMKYGYVPIDLEPEAASKTVEYAFDDWTIARMAEKMGKKDIAAKYYQRAQNYRNSFDVKTGFLRARKSDGQFREPFNPVQSNFGSDYTEGSAWQYSWYMPHDNAGLIKLLGGDVALQNKIDMEFDAKVDDTVYSHMEDISGLIGHYAHGNEPSHHVAYLYNYAGAPWKTQQRLTQVVASQYNTTPQGLSGNDDLGQMSAWLAFTAFGFYPVAPGSNEYVIGRPFLDKAVLNLPGGKHFTVRAIGLSKENAYVASVTLNGKPLAQSFIRHDQITAGGELVFTMSSTPNKEWGTAKNVRPYTQTAY